MEDRGQEVQISSRELYEEYCSWCDENERDQQDMCPFTKTAHTLVGDNTSNNKTPKEGAAKEKDGKGAKERGFRFRWGDVLPNLKD